MTSTLGVTLAAVAIGAPALAFALWPLRRRRGGPVALLPLPPDARERLTEDKRAALRALRELEFEHGAGHIGDADYADLRARYEADAAAVISELDRLAPVSPAPPRSAPAPTAPRGAWGHPAAIAVAALALLTFGVALGVGIMRYTEPDRMAGGPAVAFASVTCPLFAAWARTTGTVSRTQPGSCAVSSDPPPFGSLTSAS